MTQIVYPLVLQALSAELFLLEYWLPKVTGIEVGLGNGLTARLKSQKRLESHTRWHEAQLANVL